MSSTCDEGTHDDEEDGGDDEDYDDKDDRVDMIWKVMLGGAWLQVHPPLFSNIFANIRFALKTP